MRINVKMSRRAEDITLLKTVIKNFESEENSQDFSSIAAI
jgi:hypothetical protein